MGDASSPAIGVVLLVLIVVLLAAAFYPLFFNISTKLDKPGPYLSASSEYVANGENNDGNRPYFVLEYTGLYDIEGEDILIQDHEGNTISWFDVWTAKKPLRPGDEIHIDGYLSDGELNRPCKGDTYRIIYEPTDDVIHIVEINYEAVGKADKYC